MEADEVVAALGSDLQRGLTPDQAQERLAKYGPNALQEPVRRTKLQMFVDQLKEILVLILIGAAMISGVLGEWTDVVVILLIVVLNAILGVMQESRAEEALAALKKMSAPKARVIRNGQIQEIPARELVPGDLVRLETGDFVPADARLIEAVNLRIEESALTGESLPVEKDAKPLQSGQQVHGPYTPSGNTSTAAASRTDKPGESQRGLGDYSNLVFSGTIVSYGRGTAVVYATGMRTAIGRIAGMLGEAENEPTPLQRRMAEVGRTLGLLAGALVVIVFTAGILRNLNWLQMLLTSVSLAVAAIPEGLPAIVTIVLAMGVQRMARRHAIIRKLPAVETLGTATVIASDKTGTLTKNEMTVVRAYANGIMYQLTGEGYNAQGAFRVLSEGGPESQGNQTAETLTLAHAPGLAPLLTALALCSDARFQETGDYEVSSEQAAEGSRERTARRSRQVIGDPTEAALVVAAEKVGLSRDDLEAEWPRLAEVPFDSDRKRMTTFHPVSENREAVARLLGELLDTGSGAPEAPTRRHRVVSFTKGAPEEVLAHCNRVWKDGHAVDLDEKERQHILRVAANLADQAYRVLAGAIRFWPELPPVLTPDAVEHDMIFVGLVAEIDPPRPEVRQAVAAARHAGIVPIMITGDHKSTAVAIAKELGIWQDGSQAVTGPELEKMDDDTLFRRAPRIHVYARVSPEHKLRIVRALKAHGHVVAMTGDGVNDSPALKGADIGVAMGITGTDVAKGAADMVLADDNFATIVGAVREGRVIYANIRKAIHYLLSCNIGEIITIFFGIMLGWGRVLTPIQILWVNLVTDGLPALALGVEPPEKGVMDQPPRDPHEGIFSRGMGWHLLWQGVLIGGVTLAVFRWAMLSGDYIRAETLAFLTLAATQLVHSFNTRSVYHSVFQLGWRTNRSLLYAVAASFASLAVVVLIPPLRPIFNVEGLSWADWDVMVLSAVSILVVVELVKAVARFRMRRHGSLPS
ncbi:MAG: cation-translocating P-type ATPase [Limnochordaceae bacterium]|nr:cation-translocating P-type ATPase [Limnochordaceae bacterium]